MPGIRVHEGDWFAVPVRDGGYAIGLVARTNPRGVLFGYFFGPWLKDMPDLNVVIGLRPEHAVLVGKFGHRGLRQGEWPVLGALDSWDRDHWPMPAFVRQEEVTGRTLLVHYDNDDPNALIREEQVAAVPADYQPRDGLMGAGFVEARLSLMLRAD